MKIKFDEKPLNFIRYGLARKKEFLSESDIKQAYDGIVLPANILLYQYKSTPSLVHRCKEKYYIVDPMSYLFGQPFEEFKRMIDGEVEFKPSFEGLMEAHGLSVENFIDYDYRTLLEFLLVKENLQSFIANCLDFQINTVSSNLKKYASDLIDSGVDFDSNEYKPSMIIPPYFLYEKGSITTDLNFKILESVKILEKDIDIYPMIFIRREDLGSEFLDTIIEEIKAKNFNGYCLWVDNFRESSVQNASEITSLISLINKLSNGKNNIIMMYGGFFSLTLFKLGLLGIGHGTLFSESRSIKDSVKKVSGPPPIRYYIQDLHEFFTIDTALEILRKEPTLLCDCDACKSIVKNDPERIANYLNEEELAEMHFLYNRYNEKQNISTNSFEDIVRQLDFVIKTYKLSIDSLAKLKYLEAWHEALDSYKQSIIIKKQ